MKPTELHVSSANVKVSAGSCLTLVPSVIIRVRNSQNQLINCRALVDQCAQYSYITEDMVKRLGLTRTKPTSALHSLGEERVSKVKGQVTFSF